MGSAFNGSIGSIAKTDVSNTFSAAQTISTSGASLNVTSTSSSSPFVAFRINGVTAAGDITAVSSALLQITNATEVRLNTGGKTLKVRDDGIFGVLDAATESNVVYYNTGTDEFTYGAALWTEGGGGTTYLTTTSDNVNIGASANTAFKLNVAGSANITGSLNVDNISATSSIATSSTLKGTRLIMIEESGTPIATSGTGILYTKTDGNLYFKNDAGSEYQITP